MDDDLMSLRGSSSPYGGSPMPDEEPIGMSLDDFVPDSPEPVAPISQAAAAPAAKSKPAPKPKAAKSKAAAKPKSAPGPKTASSGGFLGMTPQQSMLLSIFLFLDVAVLGCLILIALGAIKL